MLRVWNMTLVIMTFFLTIFGTFMTRSGHRAVDTRLRAGYGPRWMFMVFMVALLTISFGLVIYRLPLLRARNELESWVSVRRPSWSILDSAVLRGVRAVCHDVSHSE